MSFHHAAVTKSLMLGCAATSIACSIFDVKYLLGLQLVPHITRHQQYWRLLCHHFASANSSDLLLTELLLYNIGIPIERIFGSSKFASFALVTTLTSSLLELGALLIFNRWGLNTLPAGPTTLLFSILYHFSRLVPSAYSFRVLGASVNNKIFVYVLALQLAISQPPGSIAVSVIGLLAGQLYRTDILGLKRYRVPKFVQRLCSKYLLPILGTVNPPRHSNRALPDRSQGPRRASSRTREDREAVATPPSADDRDGTPDGPENVSALSSRAVMREWMDELTGRSERASSGLRVPSDDEIAQVSGIFPRLSREDIVGTLQRSPNIEAAVETLLGSQTNI